MDKDEILSAYTSYLDVRPAARAQHGAEPREAVARGLVYALPAGLVGVVLGVAVSRQTLVAVNIDMLVGALTSGAMVLAYARAARTPPRRGLVPLLLLLLAMLFVGLAAIVMARGWLVYSLLDEALGMPMGRSTFIYGLFADFEMFNSELFLPFALSSAAGCCLALWKVRLRSGP